MSGARSTWSATAIWRGEGPLAIQCRGEALAALLARGESLTPVEYLLVGAAGCYALSLEAARRRLQPVPATFTVTALGTKADGAPSRLEALALEVQIDGPFNDAQADALAAAAKGMCTVTNTLGAPPTVVVQVRAGGR